MVAFWLLLAGVGAVVIPVLVGRLTDRASRPVVESRPQERAGKSVWNPGAGRLSVPWQHRPLRNPALVAVCILATGGLAVAA